MLPDNRTDPLADRLDSWKDIAAYLRRDVSTVQRWEKREGLPVHRHLHDKQGSVYAYKSELDGWWQQGRKRLEAAEADGHGAGAAPRARMAAFVVVAGALVAVLLLAIVVWRLAPEPRPAASRAAVRSLIPIPAGAVSAYALAMSPDGSTLVYVGFSEGSGTQLYLNTMERLGGTPIPGTAGATLPFFSPDGQWVGFFADGKLKKVAVRGGAPVTLCDALNPRGGTWGPNGTIVFAPHYLEGLWRVSSDGGSPILITAPDRAAFERTHRLPHFLPEGRAVLFVVGTARDRTFQDSRIDSVELDSGRRRTLIDGGTRPQYAGTGHIVYGREGALVAVPFDVRRLEVTGPPVSVVEGVASAPSTGAVAFTLSSAGGLVYAPGRSSLAVRRLVWVDRTGQRQPIPTDARVFRLPRISPDGGQIALTVDEGVPQVWLYDVRRQTLARHTLEWGAEVPVWSPDGRSLAFAAAPGTSRNTVYLQALDGVAKPEQLLEATTEAGVFPFDWSRDGAFILASRVQRGSGADVWLIPLHPRGAPRGLVVDAFNQGGARMSPDGRWLAYVSNETGRGEVFVRRLPNGTAKRQISTNGGRQPVWARNGRELFYREAPNKMMSVEFIGGNGTRPAQPRLLFAASYFLGAQEAEYDVGPDGRFLMMSVTEEAAQPTDLVLVQNWFEELRQKVPTQ